MSKILIGSAYFFSCYPDFHSKDIDEIEIVETNTFQNMRQLTGRGKCLFQLRKKNNKQDYIDYALKQNLGMAIGKFLVPEFCNIINFRIEDLPCLQPLIDILDDKHQYEKIIYTAYLQNKAFTLTDEQREEAYKSYKTSRGVN